MELISLEIFIDFSGLYWELQWIYSNCFRAILNKSGRQHLSRHQLYGHLPPIMKTIQVRRTRHAGHWWRSRDEFISDVLLWTPTYGRAKAERPARIYIQQLCEDMGCSPEDLPEAMNDREKWRERVRDIRACGTTWWWWCFSNTDHLGLFHKIFIINGFWTIVFIFIVISTTFRSICPLAFFRCLLNSGTFTELWTTSFIESTGVACSDSVSHNRVQVLSIPVLLLACSQDWTCNL